MKNNGVLYENDVLQIGVKSDYKNNLGKAVRVSTKAIEKCGGTCTPLAGTYSQRCSYYADCVDHSQ